MIGILPFFFKRNRINYFLLLAIVGLSIEANAQSFYFRSHQSGNWNVVATWESSPDGSTWTTPAITTPGAAANNSTYVLIQSGHTVTISANVANAIAGGTNIGTVTVQGTLQGTGNINFAGASLDNQNTIHLTAGTVIISGTPFSILSTAGTPFTTFNGLTVSGATASTTASTSFTTNGTLSVSTVGGSFVTNASATINGNLTATGNFTSNAQVIFSGAATQTLAGVNATFNGDVTVTNTSTSGLVGTGSPNFKGNLINNGRIGFTGGTAKFGGASPQTISGASGPATKFYSLTIKSGSSVAVNGTIPFLQIAGTSLAATGTLTSNAPVTFNRAGTTALTGTGAIFNNNVSVVSGTTVNGAGSFTIGGNLDNQGTWSTTGAVTFNGTNTVISNPIATTFSAATLIGGVTLGSISPATNFTFTTTALTLTSGTFKLNGGKLVVLTGAINTTSGIIDATTPSNLTIGATGIGTLAFKDGSSLTNFTVGRTMTIQGDATVKSLTLNTSGAVVTQSSGTLTIASGGSVTSTGGKLAVTGSGSVSAVDVYDLTYNIGAILTTGAELSLTAIRAFTKAGASTLTLNKDLITTGTFTLSAGTLTANGNAVTLNGATSTITGTAASNFAALNVNGPLTKSSTGATTITGNVVVGTGTSIGAINFTAGTTTFKGTTLITNSGSGSISLFTVTASTTANALTTNAPITIAGVLTVTSPSTFAANAGADVTLSNNLAGTGALTSNALVTFNNTTTISNTGAKIFTDVTISGTVNVTANVTSTVNGNLVNNGTINCTNGTWAFGGNTKTISGATPTATNFFNLTINNGASISTSIPFTTAGALNIVAAMGTAGMASLTTTAGFTANAAVNVFGTGSNFNANTGAFSVTGALTVGSGNFFVVDAASTATLSGNLTANGTFTNNGTLTVGGNLTGTGGLNQGTNATMNIGGTSTITNLSATVAGNTVNYTGSGQTVKGVNYYNLGFSGSASAAAGLTIGGDVTIGPAGNFTSGGFVHNVAGNWTNNGVFTGSGGTVVLNGPGLQTISGSGSGSFNNLTLNGSGTKTFGVSTTIGGALALSTGVKANLQSSSNSYTAGTLALGGTAYISGVYGSSASAAPIINDTFFVGNGVVIISNNIFYSIATMGTGSWDNPTMWSTSGSGHSGTSGSTYPKAGDIAVIGSSNIITVTGSQACSGLSFDGAGTASISASVGDKLTVSGDITGVGASNIIRFTGAGTLQVGGAMFTSANGTLTVGSGTVEYNGAGAQIIQPFTYNNLLLSGGNTKSLTTAGGVTTINGALSIADATTFVLGGVATFQVNGTTTVGGGNSGTLNITSTTGTKTFTGPVMINAGATWNEQVNESIVFRNGITNNATGIFTANTGVHTFNTNISQALSGTLSIPNATVTGATVVLTNNGTLTVGTALSGTGTLAQAASASSVLNIGGASSITILDASATSNTVNYTGAAAQTVHIGNYYNLNLSGAGTKAFPVGTTSVGNSLTVAGGALTNKGTLTVAGALSGTGSLIQGMGATLNIGGASTIANMTATANGNTVNFSGVGQTVNSVNFYHLTLSGSGTATLQTGTTSILGDLVLSGAVSTTGVVGITIGGAINIGPNTSFTSGAFMHNVGGNWINNGTFTHNGGIIVLNGTGQVIGGLNSTTFNDLTLSVSGTKTFGVSTVVAGNLSISSGVVADLGSIITHTANALILGGGPVPSGTWGSNGSGALHKNDTYFLSSSSGILTVATGASIYYARASGDWNSPVTWSTVNFGGVSAVTTPGSGDQVLIGGGFTLTVSDGEVCSSLQFDQSASTINSLIINGSLVVNGSVTIPRNGGSNTLAVGSGSLTVPGIDFISGTGAGVQQLTIGTGTATVSGDVTGIGASSTIQFSDVGTLKVGGTLFTTANGTLIPGSGTVEYNAAGAQIVQGLGYYNLTLSGSGVKTLQVGTTAVGGDIVLSGTVSTSGVVGITIGGAVNIGSGAAFTAGAFTHQVGGDWTNNTAANFVAGTGNIIFTGTGTHSINGTSNFYSFGTNGAGTINLLGATAASGILTMASGSIMNTNNNLTLLSTSDAQAASIANLTGVIFNGNVSIQRYMSAADNFDRFISSPILNAPVSQLQATVPLGTFPVTGSFTGSSNGCTGCNNGNASLWWNKESTPGTSTVAGDIPYPTSGSGSNADPLYPGVGYDSYMWNAISGMTTTFSGTINKGDINLGVLSAPFNNSITHTNTGNASADGWNLVGNPYPSAVVWNTTGWNKTNIDQTVWVWDVVGRIWHSYLDTDATGVIALGQGFWVYAPSVGSASLTIHETAKASVGTGTFYRKSNNESSIVVSVTKGDVKESAFITLNEDATNHYLSKVDFPKIQLGIESMHLSLTKDNMNLGYYAVQPNFDHDIPVRFVADEDGVYELALEIDNSFPGLENYKLVDLLTNDQVPMISGNKYLFSYSINQPVNRFIITKQDIPIVEEHQIQVFPNPTTGKFQVMVNSGEAIRGIELINISGEILLTLGASADSNQQRSISLLDYPSGVYLVRVHLDSGVIVKRVVKI